MVYTELTILAAQIAEKAHRDQTDKMGMPYIMHPFKVAESMEDEYSCCAALLHDVVKDTDIVIEDLEKLFPLEVTEAVRLLTHDDETDYFDYVRAIRKNPIAKQVKLADLAHNSDPERSQAYMKLKNRPQASYNEKYKTAKNILLED